MRDPNTRSGKRLRASAASGAGATRAAPGSKIACHSFASENIKSCLSASESCLSEASAPLRQGGTPSPE
eukprot:7740056-Pyramimonas_sp.AAC.1